MKNNTLFAILFLFIFFFPMIDSCVLHSFIPYLVLFLIIFLSKIQELRLNLVIIFCFILIYIGSVSLWFNMEKCHVYYWFGFPPFIIIANVFLNILIPKQIASEANNDEQPFMNSGDDEEKQIAINLN